MSTIDGLLVIAACIGGGLVCVMILWLAMIGAALADDKDGER